MDHLSSFTLTINTGERVITALDPNKPLPDIWRQAYEKFVDGTNACPLLSEATVWVMLAMSRLTGRDALTAHIARRLLYALCPALSGGKAPFVCACEAAHMTRLSKMLTDIDVRLIRGCYDSLLSLKVVNSISIDIFKAVLGVITKLHLFIIERSTGDCEMNGVNTGEYSHAPHMEATQTFLIFRLARVPKTPPVVQHIVLRDVQPADESLYLRQAALRVHQSLSSWIVLEELQPTTETFQSSQRAIMETIGQYCADLQPGKDLVDACGTTQWMYTKLEVAVRYLMNCSMADDMREYFKGLPERAWNPDQARLTKMLDTYRTWIYSVFQDISQHGGMAVHHIFAPLLVVAPYRMTHRWPVTDQLLHYNKACGLALARAHREHIKWQPVPHLEHYFPCEWHAVIDSWLEHLKYAVTNDYPLQMMCPPVVSIIHVYPPTAMNSCVWTIACFMYHKQSHVAVPMLLNYSTLCALNADLVKEFFIKNGIPEPLSAY